MFGFLKKLFGRIGFADVESLMENGALIVDVRTPQEFKMGHPRKAINYPLDSLRKNVKKIKKYKKPVITCCVSGRRSGVAAGMLNDFGIEAHNGGPWIRVARVVGKA